MANQNNTGSPNEVPHDTAGPAPDAGNRLLVNVPRTSRTRLEKQRLRRRLESITNKAHNMYRDFGMKVFLVLEEIDDILVFNSAEEDPNWPPQGGRLQNARKIQTGTFNVHGTGRPGSAAEDGPAPYRSPSLSGISDTVLGSDIAVADSDTYDESDVDLPSLEYCNIDVVNPRNLKIIDGFTDPGMNDDFYPEAFALSDDGLPDVPDDAPLLTATTPPVLEMSPTTLVRCWNWSLNCFRSGQVYPSHLQY